jgi:peptide/nickel transport system permease protein
MLPTTAAAEVTAAGRPATAARVGAAARAARLGRRLTARPEGRVALAGLALLVGCALFAPWLAPYAPSAQLDLVALKSQAPSAAHPFGTDQYSRDVLSRVLYGARVSLAVGFLATAVSVTVGTAFGLVAGYKGGRVDALMMRLVDVALAVPRVLLLLAVGAMWPDLSLGAFVLLLGLTQWFHVSRLVRAEARLVRETDYVTSARALGAGTWRILTTHALPNVASPVLVAATLGVANVIVLEAGLSFLGVGVQPPTPSWGNIIMDGAEDVSGLWWISIFPGLAIVATVACLNALGDALREVMDTRQVDGR